MDLALKSSSAAFTGRRWLMAVIALGVQFGTAADETRTSFPITVTVRSTATLREFAHPGSLDISSADIERGFIALSQPARLEVTSNSRMGYALDVIPSAPLFTSVAVDGLEGEAVIGADGGTIVQRWQGKPAAFLELRFKFFLRPDLTPGRYPWPLSMTARALDSAQ